MRFTFLLLALCAAGIGASAAVANDGPPVEPTSTTTTRPAECRTLLLRGSFVVAGTDGFSMTVREGSAFARPFLGKQVRVQFDSRTEFWRPGAGRWQLSAIKPGDALLVEGQACKVAGADRVKLLARRVGSKPAEGVAPTRTEPPHTEPPHTEPAHTEPTPTTTVRK